MALESWPWCIDTSFLTVGTELDEFPFLPDAKSKLFFPPVFPPRHSHQPLLVPNPRAVQSSGAVCH